MKCLLPSSPNKKKTIMKNTHEKMYIRLSSAVQPTLQASERPIREKYIGYGKVLASISSYIRCRSTMKLDAKPIGCNFYRKSPPTFRLHPKFSVLAISTEKCSVFLSLVEIFTPDYFTRKCCTFSSLLSFPNIQKEKNNNAKELYPISVQQNDRSKAKRCPMNSIIQIVIITLKHYI